MKQNTTYIVVGLIVLALLLAAIYVSLTTTTVDDVVGNDIEDEQQIDTGEPFAGITRVDIKQFYEDGQHTFVGEMMMPTPCDLLEADVVVRESMPEQIHITFDVINTAEVCAQVLTPQRFMVTAQASEQAVISAELMGYQLEVNIIEPEPGETPDDFELFIKG